MSTAEALAAARAAAQTGDPAGAEALYARVLASAPENPHALSELGVLKFQQGAAAAAEELLRHAVASVPESEVCRANLGVVLEQRGKFEEAIECYGAALTINSKRALLHTNLGNALRSVGRLADAAASFRRALELDPGDLHAKHNLGALLKELGEHAAAVALLREVVAAAPAMVDAHVNLGAALHALGEDEEALAAYREASRLVPGYPDAAAGEITILERRGETEEASRRVVTLLETAGEHPDVALAFATVAGKLDREDESAALLARILAQPLLPRGKRQALLFARGRSLDARGRYAEAFECYRQANDLTVRAFDWEDFVAYGARIRAVFTAEFLRSSPRAAHGSEAPVFVVGMPRSGTSLVEQILASHPAAAGVGELPEIDRLSLDLPPSPQGAEYPECLVGAERAVIESAAGAYLALLDRLAPGAARAVDKMPGNFLHLGFIELLFPRARVIHIRRDPLDTCLSCYFQNFSTGHEYAYDLRLLGRFHREYQDLMTHWRLVSSLRILEVSYEELVRDQETQTRALVAFAGLPWDDRCLRFHETRRVVRTASYDQVRQPMYQHSAGRHRHYEAFLQPLREALAGLG